MLSPYLRRIIVCALIVVPAIISSACGRQALPLGFGIPIVGFETSESPGAGRGYLGIAGSYSPRAVTVSDAPVEPPNTTRRIGGGIVPTYSAGLGVLNRLDVSIAHTSGPEPESKAPLMVRTKLQLIGVPAKSAKRGANSLAILAGYGTVDFDRTDQVNVDEPTSQGFPGSRGVTVVSHSEATAVQGAVLGGHRLTDRALFYGSLSYTQYRYRWSVDQTSHRPPRHFEDAGRIGQVGANAGLQYTRRAFYVRAEANFSRESFGSDGHLSMNAGLQSGLKW